MGVDQQDGIDFEHEMAARYGLERVPGSGAGVFKLDLDDIEVRMSLKRTKAESWRITAKDLREMRAGAGGPGSRGQVGMLIGRIAGIGADIAVAEVPVMFGLLAKDIELNLSSTRAREKMAAADPLAYLRS